MKVTFFGHSYVRDLKLFCLNRDINKIVTSENVSLDLDFFFVCGATFNTFISDPSLLSQIFDNPPEILVVVLGGNDVKVNVNLLKIRQSCKEFYCLLKRHLPNTFIIASQIEPRYLTTTNRFGTPETSEFIKLTNYFNSWLNKQKFKDRVLCIRGPGRLCNPELFRDKIHLNNQGLSIFYDIAKKVVVDSYIYKLNNK